jgi:hypothetical protein
LIPFITLGLFLSFTSATATYITGSDIVTGRIFTPAYTDAGITYGPFGGDYSYTRTFDGDSVTKHLEIQFIFSTDLGFGDTQRATIGAPSKRTSNASGTIASCSSTLQMAALSLFGLT